MGCGNGSGLIELVGAGGGAVFNIGGVTDGEDGGDAAGACTGVGAGAVVAGTVGVGAVAGAGCTAAGVGSGAALPAGAGGEMGGAAGDTVGAGVAADVGAGGDADGIRVLSGNFMPSDAGGIFAGEGAEGVRLPPSNVAGLSVVAAAFAFGLAFFLGFLWTGSSCPKPAYLASKLVHPMMP